MSLLQDDKEKLIGGQKKLDANKDGKISSTDFKLLREKKQEGGPMMDKPSPLPEEQEPLTLTINSKGEIFIQESKVEYEKIIAKILAVSKNRTDTRIYVRGDKTINYGRVLEVMGMLSGSGFTKVALISEPYKER